MYERVKIYIVNLGNPVSSIGVSVGIEGLVRNAAEISGISDDNITQDSGIEAIDQIIDECNNRDYNILVIGCANPFFYPEDISQCVEKIKEYLEKGGKRVIIVSSGEDVSKYIGKLKEENITSTGDTGNIKEQVVVIDRYSGNTQKLLANYLKALMQEAPKDLNNNSA